MHTVVWQRIHCPEALQANGPTASLDLVAFLPHTEREGEHIAEWAEAERHRRRVGDANIRDRVESCLAVADVGATDSEKETNETPNLAKVTRKQQMFTSEMPIRVFIGSLSFHCINKHFGCA